MSGAVRAFLEGLWMVLRAPLLVAGVLLLTLAAAVPFGLVLGTRLQSALAHQPAIALDAGEIDPEWWMEFREHARGLEATFTPTVIGFAAPLDNLSALLDGSRRPLALAVPVAISVVVWAFLWGGTLSRFASDRPIGARAFVTAGARYLPRFVAISAAAALVCLLLYLTVHALLFGPIYGSLAARVSTEREAFVVRVVLYAVFGVLLLAVSLVADYTRISMVAGSGRTLREAVTAGTHFVRLHTAAVVTLTGLAGLLFVALLVIYGTTETLGGVRVGGWRGVIIGQAYIVARLVLRLTLAASELRLFARG